jgi:hypothetical protein
VLVEPGFSPTKLTYADYLRFPDDGLRHEIIGGEHYVTASPATRHQRISRLGVEEYWLVDPERDVCDVYRRSADEFQNPIRYLRTDNLTTPVLPGLDLSLDRVLA